MPSGFRGSSRSSSSSSSRSSRSSGSSYSSSRSSRGGFIYIGGGRRYHDASAVTVRSSGWIALIIAMVFFAIISFFIGGIFNAQKRFADTAIQSYDEEYDYYQNMIDNAKEKDYIIKATVTDAIKDFDTDKYYITYKFTHNGVTVSNGHSFSIYSIQQASDLVQLGEIDIAVAGIPITSLTDSVPMDYEDFDKTQEGRYIGAYNLLNESNTAVIIAYSLSVLFLGIMIFAIVKYKKAMANQSNESITISSESKGVEKIKTCSYCGTASNPENGKCPNCGASINKNK